jgi:SAM-dependent methyltransferase
MAGYTADLAFIHDAGFGDLARAAASEVIRGLQARHIERGLVVELGCGSGIGARELLRAGYDVLGIDISPTMIRLARRNAPAARFVIASLFRVKLPRCVAVTAIGECINYAFDPGANRPQVMRLFRRVWTALEPGGLFVFDFAEPWPFHRGTRRSKHITGDGWAVLVDAMEDRERRVLIRHITSFRRVGTLYRRSEESHSVHLYSAPELAADLRAIGFRARIFRKYGGMPLRIGHAGIVATKARRLTAR